MHVGQYPWVDENNRDNKEHVYEFSLNIQKNQKGKLSLMKKKKLFLLKTPVDQLVVTFQNHNENNECLLLKMLNLVLQIVTTLIVLQVTKCTLSKAPVVGG